MTTNKSMTDDKRKRSPNWLSSEKELLLNLVERHFHVIENKKTDGVSIKSKLARWKIISYQFNSQTNLVHRTAENLKAQWERIKKIARKYASNLAKQIFQTDELSPLPDIKENAFLDRVLALLRTSAFELDKEDSDSTLSFNEHQTSNGDTQVNPKPDEISSGVQFVDVSVIHGELSANEESGEDEKAGGDFKPKMLRTPVQIDNTNKTCNTPSSLEYLHNKKIEAIELQNKMVIEEMDRAKILHDVELEIKKEKLKQEKISTSILLIKRRKLLSMIKK